MKLLKNRKLVLIIGVALIVLAPLIYFGESEFAGADGEAQEAILEISPEYKPWIDPLWEPPSGEVESLLFSLQVAVGSGAVGYVLGIWQERKKIASN